MERTPVSLITGLWIRIQIRFGSAFLESQDPDPHFDPDPKFFLYLFPIKKNYNFEKFKPWILIRKYFKAWVRICKYFKPWIRFHHEKDADPKPC